MSMFEFQNSSSAVVRQRKPYSKRQVSLGACGGLSPGGGGNPGGSMYGSGGGGFPYGGGSTRFNPVFDRLEEPSLVDEWLSRDIRQINKMFRGLYVRDEVVGPSVDMIATIPWSEYHLSGIEDKSVMRIFQESVENFDVEDTMPLIARSFLTLGRECISCIYSNETGTFQYFIPQDPDLLEITPIPIKGFDPKIDLLSSRSMKHFINSKDIRDIRALEELPQELINNLANGGKIPLEPLNTIFAPRTTFSTDWVGTSLLTRILPFWALQKALINSTLRASRRRTRAITHITAGIDEKWEPEDYELDDIAMLFMQADEDPDGAIVVTRNGIEIQDVKDPSGMWKISDEWDYLSNGKMRALGINEELLSGGMTFNNLDTALSFFMESVKNFRAQLTNQIFHYKMFRVLAKAHGFYKPRSQADSNSNYIPSRNGTDKDQYLIPQMVWHKDLKPKGDSEYLAMLRDLKDMGIPVPLARLAAAGDMDIDKLISDMPKDIQNQKRISEYNKKLKEAGGNEDEEGGDETGGMGAFANVMNQHKVWDSTGRFCGVSKHEMKKVVGELIQNGKLYEVSNSPELLTQTLTTKFNDAKKVASAKYILALSGIVDKANVSSTDFAEDMGEHIISVNRSNGKVNQSNVNAEFSSLSSYIDNDPKLSPERARKLAEKCSAVSRGEKVNHLRIWSGNGVQAPKLK